MIINNKNLCFTYKNELYLVEIFGFCIFQYF